MIVRKERNFRKSRDDEESYKEVQSTRQPLKKKSFNLKLFGRWDSDVVINDISLHGYMNLDGRLLPRSAGSQRGRFHKSRMHIVERIALHMMIPGHTGKRHRLTSGTMAGNYNNAMKHIEKALEIIELKEKKNPIEVIVRAIENASVSEEIISYQLGSIMAREAVVTAPQRRIDKTVRYIAQGAYKKSFGKKKTIEEALADEIIAASKNSADSYAVKERDRIESEAAGSR